MNHTKLKRLLKSAVQALERVKSGARHPGCGGVHDHKESQHMLRPPIPANCVCGKLWASEGIGHVQIELGGNSVMKDW